ncbi:hypothetical protein C8A00DRAFT_44748 [Chaetomidium leptoderma]|uniref:Phosphoglycerate mutase n=1 Tax=Chaetomidium leptoderma TaxID=669021 RepID=A0AAN6ZVZ5_9PEZI|nr:hypothetical protein C8A00DRAFT_44748 [Chaetomidium leptoderma]
MGRPPAYLFVVRHGYRLDAADKQWHLSSPTPYDPPLTYSGWQQAKSLGARIASIIRERVQEDELAASRSTDPSAKRKPKRYEVVLHSSPFLRCIQTSIAISAGLAQDSTPFGSPRSHVTSPSPAPTSDGRSRPTVVTDMQDTATSASSVKIQKSILRLDAFLGEWLSPSYFEFITPPPESVMMLASAKADLLRREDYTYSHPSFVLHSHSNSQGQLWSPTIRESSASPSSGGSQSSGRGSMANLATPLSASSSTSGRSDQQGQPGAAGYVSPVPHYAVNNNTIPQGYVSHARDACVMIDYQWQSTRGTLDWGDGGTFPEEWAAMHKRFRAGVQSLVDWYSTAENPARPVTKSVRTDSADDLVAGEDDVETESVVILVSHGAGCNALIGAITHQPVLMDVAMASLTMAVRKPSTGALGIHEGSSNAPPVHELYDLKLFANTDHLRSPIATPTAPRPPAMPNAMDGIRGRHSSFSTSMNSFSWNDSSGSRNPSAHDIQNNLRKNPNTGSTVPRLSFGASTGGITVGSGMTSFAATRPSNLGRTGTSGLWSPIATQFEDDGEEDDDIPVLNFGYDKPAATVASPTPASPPAPESKREMTPLVINGINGAAAVSTNGGSSLSAERSPNPEPEQLGAGTGGLWGVPRPPDDADRLRDVSGWKRRWTVSERS